MDILPSRVTFGKEAMENRFLCQVELHHKLQSNGRLLEINNLRGTNLTF